MKEFTKDIRNDRTTYRSFLLTLVIIMLSIFYILYAYNNLPPYIPLFNQLPWGDQRTTNTLGIFIPSAIAFAIFIFNVIFASFVYKKAYLVSRIIAVASLLISILTFLFVIRTIQIVL
jgi:hypothetical protein